jgi:putative transcriptional regulator
MTMHPFKKIMAGLDDARAYLDGTADKRRYRVHVPEKADV